MRTKFLPFEVLHEDRDVIVIDKPAGLLATHTHLAGRAARETQQTAENFLNAYVRKGQAKSSRRVWLVHRLDRETSGVMMFAKDERVASAFRERWGELTEKTYIARVQGEIAEAGGVFESYLQEDATGYRMKSVPKPVRGGRSGGGAKAPKFARTEWRRISCGNGTTLVEVKLKTGRKNQIRVHFSEAGHPVVGDVKYGGRKARRMFLHSLRLGYTHPLTGEAFEFESRGTMK